MSDFSQGEGWWQASDGKWYPPEAAPPGFAVPTSEVPTTQPFGPPPGGAPTAGPPTAGLAPMPMAAPTPAKPGLGTGPIVAIVVAVVLVIGAIAFFATRGDSGKKNASATQSSSPSSSSRSSSSKSSTSSSSSGAPTVVAPAGFKVFSNDKDAFALAIPANLQIIDLTTGDIDRLIQQLSDVNPELAKLGPQIKSIFANGGKLFAIDVSSGGFSDNVNVLATPGSVDVTNASAKSQVEQQLAVINATNIQFETLTVHGRKVLTSSYEAIINGADGTPISFFGRQAVVSAGGQVWFITFSTSADSAADFSTMVQTFDVNA